MTENNIGKSIYFATAHPATNDAAGFEALTWVKANGVQTLPQLGVTHAMIDVTDLESGFTAANKGAGSGVDTSMTFRRVDGDTGQDDVETTANAASGKGSIKIIRASGVAGAPVTGDPVEYAQGIAHSYQDNQGDTTTHEGFSVSFRQNDFTVKGTEPV